MPRIAEFYGIIICMYYDDHLPPHFHALYGNDDAAVAIVTLQLIKGQLPGRAAGLVREWASAHASELLANWERARNHKPLEMIPPLE